MSELLSEIYDLSASPQATAVSEPAVRDAPPVGLTVAPPAAEPPDADDFLDLREFAPRWWPLPLDEE